MTKKQLIHELYVELTTRKLALEYNEETDCMYEVLNSWFKAFTLFRENMKKCGNPDCYSYILYNKAMTAMRPFLEIYSHDFRERWEAEKNQRAVFEQSSSNQYSGQPLLKDFQDQYIKYKEMVIKIKEIQQELKQISIECKDAILLANNTDNLAIKKNGDKLENYIKNNFKDNFKNGMESPTMYG